MFDLVRAVEEQGGTHLDDMCVARQHTFQMDDDSERTIFAAGCGNILQFEIPYEVAFDGTNAAMLDTIKLCGVCDDMPLMPRFIKHIRWGRR